MKKLSIISGMLLIMFIVTGCTGREAKDVQEEGALSRTLSQNSENRIIGSISDSRYKNPGRITIKPFGDFDFDPREIKTVRDDIFREGFFSVFDVLVHLHKKGEINLIYHFDERMNTHVIDSINGESNYWYMAYYDGGWPENNIFRMDHYPYKDKMHIRVSQYDQKMFDLIYDIFRDEIKRRKENRGRIVIPKVVIRGPTTNHIFENVDVTAHNLREDIFQNDVITAIDAIMSLGDEDKISYDLRWHESIGSAQIVKNFFVDRVDENQASGRCGFVYESGALGLGRMSANHIHIPPDSRILNSPEYVEFFWICL